jgi:galactonate dehydratase
MRISDIKTYLVGNPWKNWLFVRVETDEGVVGIGEGTLGHLSRTVEAAVRELKPLVIGFDVFRIEAMQLHLMRDVFADGGQIKMCAISAMEIACWDAIGRALKQPIYNLLGGLCREKVRAYANGWYRCPRTPEAFAEAAVDVVKRGFTAMKFDPFGVAWRKWGQRDLDLALDIVRSVRGAVGAHVDLAIEAHARFNATTAIAIGKRLESVTPAWFEDPVPHYDPRALVEVARHIDVPVGTGESLSNKQQFVELMRDGAIDVITLEPLHVGGILASRKIADLVDAHHGVIVPHSAQGPVCTLAGLQIAACTPNHYMQEYFDPFNVGWEKDLLTWHPRLVNGYLEIPTAPGLGADLNLDVVRAHPYHEHPDMNMWEENWHFRRDEEAKSGG